MASNENKSKSHHKGNHERITIMREQIHKLATDHKLIEPDTAHQKRLTEILDYIPNEQIADVLERLRASQNVGGSNIEQFTKAHRISPAEGRLLESLINGITVVEHAKSANISINTARTQMRQLIEKTETSGQLDLLQKYFKHRP